MMPPGRTTPMSPLARTVQAAPANMPYQSHLGFLSCGVSQARKKQARVEVKKKVRVMSMMVRWARVR